MLIYCYNTENLLEYEHYAFLGVVFSSFYFVFFCVCVCVLFNPLAAYPLPHPENSDLGRLCGCVPMCGGREEVLYQSTTNGWFGREEQCQ